jgi:hypothetical protein
MVCNLDDQEDAMKVLTKEGAADLLSVDTLDTFLSQRSNRLHPVGAAYSIPPDSGAKTALAKFLAYLLLKHPEVCVYLTGWSLRPSSEHLDLFYGYRRSTGETRLLSEAPVHVFDRSASDELVSILCMMLYFGWDACVFDVDCTTMVRFTHDGRLEIRADNQRDFGDFAADPGRYLTPLLAKSA